MLEQFDVAPLGILQERLETLLRDAIALSPNILAGGLFLVFVWLLARSLRWVFGKFMNLRKTRPALRRAIQTLVAAIVWLAGGLIAATIILPGLSPAEALTGIGIGSIALGLAFRDIFENFLAGLFILLRQPMRIGDFIECQDISGRVEKITIRDTYVRRTDGVLTMLPNAYLYKNPVDVITDRTLRRQDVTVGIAYGEDVDEARAVIQNAIASLETVRHEQPVQVFASQFASSSIDFEVVWWSGSSPYELRRSRDEVVTAIKRELDEAGIEIPFPYRTLVFKNGVPAAPSDWPASENQPQSGS